MKINSKSTSKLAWGLAWAGLALILIVPSADYLTGQGGPRRATAMISGTEALPPVVPAPGKIAIKTTPAAPKPMPDYISDGPAPDGNAPDVQMASIAPVPYPREMRPRLSEAGPAEDQPLIIDEAKITPVASDQSRDVTGDIGPGQAPQNWDAQSLADYLDQQGLIGDAPGDTRASNEAAPSPDYDSDGFFLSDGPNAAPGGHEPFDPADTGDWDFMLF